MADEHSPELGRAVLESPLAESGAGVLESWMFFWIRMADVVDRRYPLAHPFKKLPPTGHTHTLPHIQAAEVNTVGKITLRSIFMCSGRCSVRTTDDSKQTSKQKSYR